MTPTTPKLVRLGLPILGSFGGGSLYGWSGYAPAVQAGLEASHSTTALIFSVALVSFTLGVLAGPALFSKVPVRYRLGIMAGASALCLGLAGVSLTLVSFCLSYGAGFGFLSGALYNHAISGLSRTRSAALLVPVTVAAFGLGGAIFGASSMMLAELGFGLWSNLPVLLCLAVVAVIALVFGAGEEAELGAQNSNFFWPNRKIAALWVIFAIGSLPGLIVLGMATYFVPNGVEAVGLAAVAVVLAAVGNTAGRLAASAVAPRFGAVRGVILAFVLSALSLLALILLGGSTAVLVALFCVALAYGHLAATMPLLVKTSVGADDFPTAFGWVFTGWGFAGLVGPWGAGLLYDQTGQLTVALAVCVLLVVAGLLGLLYSFPLFRSQTQTDQGT